MSIRKLVARAARRSVLVVAMPHRRVRRGPGQEAGKELVECVETALKDNKAAIDKGDYTDFKNALDDCNKAKSLVTPALPEIIWGGIAFLIVLVRADEVRASRRSRRA